MHPRQNIVTERQRTIVFHNARGVFSEWFGYRPVQYTVLLGPKLNVQQREAVCVKMPHSTSYPTKHVHPLYALLRSFNWLRIHMTHTLTRYPSLWSGSSFTCILKFLGLPAVASRILEMQTRFNVAAAADASNFQSILKKRPFLHRQSIFNIFRTSIHFQYLILSIPARNWKDWYSCFGLYFVDAKTEIGSKPDT